MDGRKAPGATITKVSRVFQSNRLSKRLLAEAYERVVPTARRVIQSAAPVIGMRQRREVAS